MGLTDGHRAPAVHGEPHLPGPAENKITDLSALEPLTELRSLNLRQNEISDLSPLAGMTQMEELQLSGGSGSNGNSGISDLSPLANMKNLTYLSLPLGLPSAI